MTRRFLGAAFAVTVGIFVLVFGLAFADRSPNVPQRNLTPPVRSVPGGPPQNTPTPVPTATPGGPNTPTPTATGNAFIAANAIAGPDLSQQSGFAQAGLSGQMVAATNPSSPNYGDIFAYSFTDGTQTRCQTSLGIDSFATYPGCYTRSTAAKTARFNFCACYSGAVGEFGEDYDQLRDLLFLSGLGLDTEGGLNPDGYIEMCDLSSGRAAFTDSTKCTVFDPNATFGTSPYPAVTSFPIVDQTTHAVYFSPAGGAASGMHVPNGVWFAWDGTPGTFGNGAHWKKFDVGANVDSHLKGHQYALLCNGLLIGVPFGVAGGYWPFFNESGVGYAGFDNAANWTSFQDPFQTSGYTGQACNNNAVYVPQFAGATGHFVTRVGVASGWNGGSPVANANFKRIDFKSGVPGYVDPGAWQGAAFDSSGNLYVTGNQSYNMCSLPNAGASNLQTPTAWTCYQSTSIPGITSRGGWLQGGDPVIFGGRLWGGGYGSATAAGGIQWISWPVN